MRPALLMRPLFALGAVVALMAAACSGGADAGWTFAPVPSATPAPATASPSGGTGSPSPSGSAPTSPGPSGSGTTGDVVKIVAVGIAFQPTEVTVPATKPFVIDFDNQDAGLPHNVAIRDSSNAELFLGEIFNGPGTRQYQVGALAAGAYTFICTVHPNMVGTLTAA